MQREWKLYFVFVANFDSGRGCVLDLGMNHPFGLLGFIRCHWTKGQKEEYDRTGRPPYWAGKLHNNFAMVTVAIQSSRWRRSYAPEEGTPGEVDFVRTAHPCLVICTSLPREMSEFQTTRWLVPSEFMPKVQVGQYKKHGNKAPLFLEDKQSVQKFRVTNSQMHSALWEFVSGKEEISIGYKKVKVKPAAYLKSMRSYKISSDVNFDITIGGRNARA